VRCESKVTPNVLMVDEMGTTEPAALMLVIGAKVFARCTVPKIIQSDLSAFRANPLQQNQVCKSVRQSSTWDILEAAVVGDIAIKS